MMILITGGSGSGKSAYAEERIAALSGNCRKYYIATMQVYGQEGQAKVERHRKLRSGKGFYTIEQPTEIEDALTKIKEVPESERAASECTALLECVTNLTANEMFFGETAKAWKLTAEKIIQGVERLKNGVKHLVIVSGNVFEDGIDYGETTMEYIRAMGYINEKLAAMADEAVEVVVGIPVVIKKRTK